ncbi:FtsX-like permease family protein [Micromonospora olivasterospora]|uniref:FtsX-like permease family protein n=1 Tax=Micromonospora olivasterospora TaxID=1880 RepID=A0A562I4B2_MICOL|nr:FtsX-like permease family protein [Micromonospora olivasterospora]TWH65869.1 FtsX-like permease family protein [Micromonospora olivasterospora]
MSRTFSLAIRLVRGGGAAGITRLALMTVGMAVGVAVTTLVVMLPSVLDHRAAASSGRLPAPAGEAGSAKPTFMFALVEDSWKGQRFSRVLLAPLGTDAVPPPGVERFPGPGEIIASPSAAALLADHPELGARVPGRVTSEIAAEGLLAPDEMFAYVGVTPDRLEGGSEASGFGVGFQDDIVRETFDGVARELGVLVLTPALIYVVVCGRLAAATRARRYAALRLIGLRRSHVLRIAATESAITGGFGALVGVLLYEQLSPPVARSGALGFTWYPEVSDVGAAGTAAIVLLAAVVSALVGALGLRQSLNRPVAARAAVEEPPARWWLLLPLILGLGLMLPVILRRVTTGGTTRVVYTDVQIAMVLTGMVLAGVGVVLAIRPIVSSTARAVAHPSLPLTLRLAGRRLSCTPSSTLRLLSGLAVLVLVGGISAGVLRDDELAAGPEVDAFTVTVDARRAATPQVREKVALVPAQHRWTVQYSIARPPANVGPPTTAADRVAMFGVAMVTAPCAQIRVITKSALPGCRDGADYRLVDAELHNTAEDIPPGVMVQFADDKGESNSYRTPEASLVVDDLEQSQLHLSSAILVAAERPRFGWPENLLLNFVVAEPESNVEAFKSAVLANDPTAAIDVQLRNIPALEAYRAHRGTISTGVMIGFFLGAAAFLIAVVDRAIDRRRDVISLLVLGMPLRSVRASQLFHITLPLIAVLVVTVAVGHVAGNAWLQLNGRYSGWYGGTLKTMLPLAGLAALAAISAAPVVVGKTIRAEDMRRE